MTDSLPFVSVIIPTRNAADRLDACLRSVQELAYPQSRLEIIVSDGLSTDATRAIAGRYGAKVILDYHQSVVSGRNVAWASARGELVAFTDADCVVDRNWLKNSLPYFEDPKVGGIGGPNLVPPDETAFGRAVGLIFEYAPYVTQAAHSRILPRVIEARSHGANAVYRASVLRQVMPVDEDLIGGEDVIMNQMIEERGYKLLYVPDVIVYHYRRPTPAKLWRQMYRYGMGRILLPRKRSGNLRPAHLLVGVILPILLVTGGALALVQPAYALGLAAGLFALGVTSAALGAIRTRSLRVGLDLPLVLTIFVAAWSCGFLRELFFSSATRSQPDRTSGPDSRKPATVPTARPAPPGAPEGAVPGRGTG